MFCIGSSQYASVMFVSMTALGASAAPDPGWPNATIYSLNTGLVAARQLPDPSASLANHHSAQTVETAIFRNSLVIPENAYSYTFVHLYFDWGELAGLLMMVTSTFKRYLNKSTFYSISKPKRQ